MILKRISILNYKNLEQVEIGFSAKLNCRTERDGKDESAGCSVLFIFLQEFG